MKNLEDDVYSFGFILLESLVGPSAISRKEEFLMNEMVFDYFLQISVKSYMLNKKKSLFGVI